MTDAVWGLVGTLLAALIIGYFGVETWRRQLRGKTEYELARRLLRAAFRTRDALKSVRNPLMSYSEIEQAMKDSGYSAEEIKVIDSEATVYNARWQVVSNALSDLRVEALEAEVLWGRTVQDCLQRLCDCVSKLRVNLGRHLRRKPGGGELTDEQFEELDSIVFDRSGHNEDDRFSAEIQSAIEGLQDSVKPKLKI